MCEYVVGTHLCGCVILCALIYSYICISFGRSANCRVNYAEREITLISFFFQIYLPKLHENIKYYWLNLFKEIAINFNRSLQTTSESPTSLSDALFLQINKCYRYPCLQFIFAVILVFCRFHSQQRLTHYHKVDSNLRNKEDRCLGCCDR